MIEKTCAMKNIKNNHAKAIEDLDIFQLNALVRQLQETGSKH